MAKDDMTPRKHRCSFCGKSQDQVRRLVAGPGAYICNECIALCQEIVADDMDVMTAAPEMGEIPKPAEMKAVLDEYLNVKILTPTMLSKLIERIEVGHTVKNGGVYEQEITIYYRFIGAVE